MIAAPFGVKGETLIEPFVRMARGENALHEHNTVLGEFQHPHGWALSMQKGERITSTVAWSPAGTIQH
jgi:hypothetical protein